MDMPKPSEAHVKLNLLVGEWLGDEHIHPSPWDPQGGKAIGRVHNRLALDGFSVVQDYEQERNGKINFRGHGVFTWNQIEQCYYLYWFDSMGMPPSLFKGTLQNQALTLVNKNEQGHSRAVWDFNKNGAYSYRMEVSPDGNQWYPFMEGTYNKEG